MRVKMTGKAVAFRIDVILQSVNELRQEKQALEQRYAEEKYRSKNIEMKLEQERVKFCQSRDRNSKMQETVKLAQKKVAQTDSQADRLNEINYAKQNVIADLNEKIKQETNKQENDVNEFQFKLTELTQFFRDAKITYAKDHLTKETKEWKDSMDTIVNEAETKSIELEDVTKAFENLSVDTNKIKDLVGEKMGHKGLTYKELKAAIDQLTRKQEQLQKFLKWLESCENKATAEIREYNKRSFAAGQDRANRMVETEIADVINITPAQTYENAESATEGQLFRNGQHPSRNEYRDTPENYPVQQNYTQPPNNVDQGLRNHHHVPNQNGPPVARAAPAHFPERANNVDQGLGNHHVVPSQNTAPVARAVSAHFPERANNVDQGLGNHHVVPSQNATPVTSAAPVHFPERANNVDQGLGNHHVVPSQNTAPVARAVSAHFPERANNVDQGLGNHHVVPSQNTTPVARAVPAHFPEHANNVDQALRNHHVVPSQNTTPVTRAAPAHFPERANNVDQGLRNHVVPNQNGPPVARAVPAHFPELANNVDQGLRNHHVVPSQNTTPVARAAPAHFPALANNVDQGLRNHVVPSQNTAPVARAAPAHFPAVNSPSFFISLPFGRTR